MRTIWLVIGTLAIVAGSVFLLQGLGVLARSYMSGDPKWAWIGGAMALGGLGLVAWTRRRPRP
jgi:MYXO-CTERM domain-containing protein